MASAYAAAAAPDSVEAAGVAAAAEDGEAVFAVEDDEEEVAFDGAELGRGEPETESRYDSASLDGSVACHCFSNTCAR